MVVRLREVIHRPHHDLPILDHRAVLGCVHPENGRLRRIDDRRREHGAEHAAVRNRVGASGQLFDGELAVLRALAEVGDRLFDFGDRHQVRVAENGHDQAAWASHGDADVEIAVVDDVGAVDRRVDRRKFLQGVDRGLDEKPHEPELDAVLFFEALLVAAAQLYHRTHIHFVEGRENGGRRLRLHQPLGNALPKARHRNALLGTRSLRRLNGCRPGAWLNRRRRSGNGCRLGGIGPGFRGGRDHVALGDPSAASRAGDAAGTDILLGHHLACRRQRGGFGRRHSSRRREG